MPAVVKRVGVMPALLLSGVDQGQAGIAADGSEKIWPIHVRVVLL